MALTQFQRNQSVAQESASGRRRAGCFASWDTIVGCTNSVRLAYRLRILGEWLHDLCLRVPSLGPLFH